MSSSDASVMAEYQYEFWSWLNDTTKKMSEAGPNELSEIFNFMIEQFSLINIEREEAIELILHGLYFNGETLEDGKALIQVAIWLTPVEWDVHDPVLGDWDCLTSVWDLFAATPSPVRLDEDDDDDEEEEYDDMVEEMLFWDGYHNCGPDVDIRTNRVRQPKWKPLKTREIKYLIRNEQKKTRQQGRRYQFTQPTLDKVWEETTTSTAFLKHHEMEVIGWYGPAGLLAEPYDSKGEIIIPDVYWANHVSPDETAIRYTQQELHRLHTVEFRKYVEERLRIREEEKIKRFGQYVTDPYYPNGELMDEYDYQEEMINACRLLF